MVGLLHLSLAVAVAVAVYVSYNLLELTEQKLAEDRVHTLQP